MQPWSLAAEAVATLALIVVSAKAHGRQIRLERERHGVWTVDFRADNDPWVEQLWRRDRFRFWGIYPVFLVGGLAVVALWVKPAGPAWVAWLFVAAGWAMAACFITIGLVSSFRLLRAMKAGVPSEEWRRAARWGGWLWWGSVAICGAVALLILA